MAGDTVRILLIEDNAGDIQLIREAMADSRTVKSGLITFEIEIATRLDDGLEKLYRGGFDVVLLDLTLPDSQGFATLEKVREQEPETPIVLMTVIEDEAFALQAVRVGAQDFLMKSQMTGDLLARSIRYAIERKQREMALQKANEELENKVMERTINLREANDQLMIEAAERMQVEKSLLMTQFSVDNSSISSFWTRPDGSIFYANKAACDSLGYTRDELLSLSVHDIDPNLTPDLWMQRWEELKKRPTYTLEKTHRAKNGRIFPVEVTVNYLKYDGEEYNIAFVQDITARKEALEALQESIRRYKSLVDASPVGILATDVKRNAYYINKRWTDITGHSREELIGRNWINTIHPDDRKHVSRAWQKAVKKKLPIVDEYRFVRPDGSSVWVYGQAVAEKNEHEETVGYVGTITDISDRKNAENELLLALKEAEAANIAKSQFLAMVSHELRTPLTSIIGFPELLLESELTREQRTYINTILANGLSLRELVEDILDFSSIEAGKLDIRNEPFKLFPFLKTIISIFSIRAEEKGLSLELNTASGLPETMISDDARVRQILVNLLSNAIKFTSEGEVSLNVRRVHSARSEALTVPAEKEGFLIEFRIGDTGIGISPEKRHLLFKPFTQLDSSLTREYDGTGLGLSICKRLSDLLGGEIEVESEPGKGSVFIFTLPVRVGEEVQTPKASVPTDEPEPFVQPETIRILVAEDHEGTRFLITRLLKKMGYKPECAANGREVMQYIEKQDFDLILMDVHMPEVDGFTVTKQIREIEDNSEKTGKVHIIALTADVLPEVRKKCLDSGMDGYLEKPIRLKDLKVAVSRVASLLKPEMEVFS